MRCPEDLLALSAAGLLEAAEERQVREHARECAACATSLESFGDLAMGLRQLPAPAPPAFLAARVAQQMAEYADRRQGALMAGGVAILAWVAGVAGWYAAGRFSSTAAMVWLVWSVGSAMTAVPVMAGALRRGRAA
jgi:hypothetical protein